MNNFDSRILSIEQATGIFLHNKVSTASSEQSEISFSDILTQKSDEVKFSKHANQRLESRNITLSDTQMNRLNQGVNQARGKT